MGFASIVATALGIILLIVTAYVLVSGVLVASETVVEAQKDMTAIQVKMLGTSLKLTEGTNTSVKVTNAGSEPIRDFENMDVYLSVAGGEWTLYRYSSGWSVVGNINHLDPGDEITINFDGYAGSISPEIQITTPNGISAFWSP